jgi:hypothetical protein
MVLAFSYYNSQNLKWFSFILQVPEEVRLA